MSSADSPTSARPPYDRGVVLWLLILCGFVFAMVVVGGVTRLTHSGLSMVDWRPIMGVLPPLDETAWQKTFAQYQEYPEYLETNRGMTLEEFKGIFYWEYGHRLLGRSVGLVFLLPFSYFWARRRLTPALVRRLLFAFFLGGLQGVLGWYMVKSGLVDIPRVSHYRLAAHLSLALFLLAYLYWIVLDLKSAAVGAANADWPRVRQLGLLTTSLVCLQIVWGAFVAGLKAGWGYNTFPTMNGQWVPEAIGASSSVWRDLLESGAGVQFTHRWLGTLLLLTVAWLWSYAFRLPLARRQKASLHLLAGILCLQYLLGVYILLAVIPIVGASLHQAVGCLVLLAALTVNYRFRRTTPPPAAS